MKCAQEFTHVRVSGDLKKLVDRFAQEEDRSTQNAVDRLLTEALRARGLAGEAHRAA